MQGSKFFRGLKCWLARRSAARRKVWSGRRGSNPRPSAWEDYSLLQSQVCAIPRKSASNEINHLEHRSCGPLSLFFERRLENHPAYTRAVTGRSQKGTPGAQLEAAYQLLWCHNTRDPACDQNFLSASVYCSTPSTGFPSMARMTNSTRRFCSRPLALSLSAMGWVSP